MPVVQASWAPLFGHASIVNKRLEALDRPVLRAGGKPRYRSSRQLRATAAKIQQPRSSCHHRSPKDS
jgi:hypothetical protein